MSKIERLLTLTAVLLHRSSPITAEELRDEIPGYATESDAAFLRKFDRDKNELRDQGIPIEVVKVARGHNLVDAYQVQASQYYLPDPGLDSDELSALALASSLVRTSEASNRDAIQKLGGYHLVNVDETLVSLPTNDHVVELFGACMERLLVSFTYNGDQRTVEPYSLHLERGLWYLLAFDLKRQATRSFRIDRFEGNLHVQMGEHFQPRPQLASSTLQGISKGWQLSVDPPLTCLLAVDQRSLFLAIHDFGEDAIVERRADGSAVFSISVTNRRAFRSVVLGYLDDAEILEPQELREDLLKWLQEIIEGNA